MKVKGVKEVDMFVCLALSLKIRQLPLLLGQQNNLFIVVICTCTVCVVHTCVFGTYSLNTLNAHFLALFKAQHLNRLTDAPLKVINSAMAAFILETMAQHGEPSEVKDKKVKKTNRQKGKKTKRQSNMENPVR